ncbi:phosphate/phosphite/phosphonate ABC transporter substrate-binding protein [Thermodesulfobacteriota bacterium B35]
MTRFRPRPILCILLCLLAAASQAMAAGYTLSMLPRYSIEEIHRRIAPLADYLQTATGLTIRPLLVPTFARYSKQLASGIDIGYENPYIYVLASAEHQVIAMAEKGKDNDRFRGIIIVRADSPLRTLDDLRGKTISIVGFTSAGGYLSQKLTLQEHGLAVRKECRVEEAPDNKQENVILAVYTGDADAGFIRESALHKVDAYVPATAIRVLAETAWLPNWALSVRRSMPAGDREKITRALLELPPGSPVLQALKIKKFRRADDAEYNSIRRAAGLPVPGAIQAPVSTSN